MVKFGPSGNSDSFYNTCKESIEAPKWLKERSLDAYEYSFARGTNIKDETLKLIGNAFKKENIALSVHAPYFINFANPDELLVEKSYGYIINSLKKMKILGATRCIFHAGSLTKQTREEANRLILLRLAILRDLIYDEGLQQFYICPETMGKHGQVGTVDEVIEMCKIDKIFMPTLDFGHINAYTGGSLKTKEDYLKIFNKLIDELGDERGRNVHIHFSKIEYGDKGELKHLTFDSDSKYGPEFKPLAEAMKELNINAVIVCES
ncbi:MAG: TIM barrel protein, partial [Clostridia bacterium]